MSSAMAFESTSPPPRTTATPPAQPNRTVGAAGDYLKKWGMTVKGKPQGIARVIFGKAFTASVVEHVVVNAIGENWSAVR